MNYLVSTKFSTNSELIGSTSLSEALFLNSGQFSSFTNRKKFWIFQCFIYTCLKCTAPLKLLPSSYPLITKNLTIAFLTLVSCMYKKDLIVQDTHLHQKI